MEFLSRGAGHERLELALDAIELEGGIDRADARPAEVDEVAEVLIRGRGAADASPGRRRLAEPCAREFALAARLRDECLDVGQAGDEHRRAVRRPHGLERDSMQ